MTAAPLTDEGIAYVIDRFLASHPWVEARIQSASGAAEAADVARAELRNSGFSHLVDFGTTCPACGRRADREPDRGGWF